MGSIPAQPNAAQPSPAQPHSHQHRLVAAPAPGLTSTPIVSPESSPAVLLLSAVQSPRQALETALVTGVLG